MISRRAGLSGQSVWVTGVSRCLSGKQSRGNESRLYHIETKGVKRLVPDEGTGARCQRIPDESYFCAECSESSVTTEMFGIKIARNYVKRLESTS